MNTNRYDSFLERKNALLDDPSICEQNRRLFRRFFEFEEYKLKRRNRLTQVDDSSVITLEGYLTKFKNVNRWFANKPWTELTEEDIRRVYDELEDGKILSARGGRFSCRVDYYNKIFKSKPFDLAGKAQLAKQVIEFATPSESVVRFVLEPEVRKLIEYVFQRPHRLLVWLAFDVGENINSLLVLKKRDFSRQTNPDTGEPEYRVQLRREILKRSRTPRSEITNYRETVQLLDEHLANRGDDEPLFDFGYGGAAKFLSRAADAAGVRCQPYGQAVTWKDLRSGMACDLLRKGWSSDEVNARLGHRPSSKEIDKYINFMALDRHRPKAKAREFEMVQLQEQLEHTKARERLMAQRFGAMEQNLELMRTRFSDVATIMQRNPKVADVELALALKTRENVQLN
ncbi:MAG: hypothetical protein WC661_01555 [Opitutaceae bacterium]